MKIATLQDDGYRAWIAEYDGKKFSIWLSYLWDDNGNWHYYYTVDRLNDGEGYFRMLAGNKSMTQELATKLCKKCIANIK